MVVDTLGSALDAIARGERMSFRREVIDVWREQSWAWLARALQGPARSE